jgi:hypothetical protein
MVEANVPWVVSGEAFQTVYHGGKRKVRKIDVRQLQARDYGFYGPGFYVTTSYDYARCYGHIISEYRFHPDASILVATLKPEDAPSGMVDAVVGHIDQKHRPAALARGRGVEFGEELERIRENHLDWKMALNVYGHDLGVDVIAFCGGEVVVFTPESLIFVR